MRTIKFLLIVIIFLYTAHAKENTNRKFGAPVFYPTTALEGISLTAYWLKFFVNNETYLLLPFGGSFHLFSAINKGVAIGQQARLKKLNKTPDARLLGSQIILLMSSFLVYGTTVAIGFKTYDYNSQNIPLKLMVFTASSIMTLSFIYDIKAFNKEGNRILDSYGNKNIKFDITPLVFFSENNIQLGLRSVITF